MNNTSTNKDKLEKAKNAFNSQDLRTAFELSKPLAEEGIDEAQMLLGMCYGLQKDFDNAIKWIKKAANQNLSSAQLKLVGLYGDASFGHKDEYEALKWLKKAVKNKNHEAEFRLANAYGAGVLTVEQNWKKALDLYKLVVENAPKYEEHNTVFYHESFGNLGSVYTKGLGNVNSNYDEAFIWWKKGADLDYPKSKDGLKIMSKFFYQQGLQEVQNSNYKEGKKLFEKAIEGDVAGAYFALGALYHSGKGIRKNRPKAEALFEKACNEGDLEACVHLAIMYHKGDGVTKNPKKTVTLLKKACDGNFADACHMLAYRYYKGNDVVQDTEKALELYKKACDAGIEEACETYKQIKKGTGFFGKLFG